MVAGHDKKRSRRIGYCFSQNFVFLGPFLVDQIAGHQDGVGAILARLLQGAAQLAGGLAAVIGPDMGV